MPKNKKCQFKTDLVKDYGCPESTIEDPDYCILHKPNKTDQEIELFEERINKKLQNKDYVFTGFCFPRRIDFTSLLLKYGDNKRPTFEGDADFKESTFDEGAHFKEVIFDGDASF